MSNFPLQEIHDSAGPATDLRPSRRWGGVGYVLLGFVGVIALIVGLGSWSVMARLAGAVVGQGVVTVETRRQAVQHPDGGVVAEILARDGDFVREGEVLMRLDGTLKASELRVIDAEYFEIAARIARSEAERDGQKRITVPDTLKQRAAIDPHVTDLLNGQQRLLTARFETFNKQLQQFNQQKKQVAAQIEGFENELTALQLSNRLTKEELRTQERLLRRGLTRASRVIALKRTLAENQGRSSALDGRISSARARDAEIESEIAKARSERISEAIGTLRDLRQEFEKTAQRREALLGVLSRLNVRAPAAGTVINSTVSALRSVVKPAQSILEIVPKSDRIVVETRIAVQDIDRITKGQDALLRFSAFQSENTPELRGSVVKISADALRDAEDRRQQPYYAVTIAFSRDRLTDLSERSLVPGMPVETFIVSETRSVFSYLMKPYSDYFARAFRE